VIRPTIRPIGNSKIDNSPIVNSSLRNRLSQLQPLGKCTALAAVLLAALIVAVPIGIALVGAWGAWAAVVAAITVFVASVLSLFAAAAFQSRQEAMWALLFSMGLRMSIPMAACLLVLVAGGPLTTGGFVYFVLAFYLIALPVETLLAMSQIGHKPSAV
jgi:hypothetical protein